MKALEGSEKQIRWAVDIRRQYIHFVDVLDKNVLSEIFNKEVVEVYLPQDRTKEKNIPPNSVIIGYLTLDGLIDYFTVDIYKLAYKCKKWILDQTCRKT